MTRRIVVSAPTKRPMMRFAKGPSDTGGFKYPRRRVTQSTPELPVAGLISSAPVIVPVVDKFVPNVVVAAEPVVVRAPEPVVVSNVTHAEPPAVPVVEASIAEAVPPTPEPVETTEPHEDTEQPSIVVVEAVPTETALEQPVDTIQLEPQKVEIEVADDTVGPDSHSSEVEVQEESESEEEEESESEEEEVVRPAPVPVSPPPPTPIIKSVKQSPKQTPKQGPKSPVIKKVTFVLPPPPVPSLHPIAPAASPTLTPARVVPAPPSRLSKLMASVPYSTHLLGLALVCITCVLLHLLYQFGADLAGDLDLRSQLVRFVKVAVLFGVVAVCVNFIEDNKEPPLPSSLPSSLESGPTLSRLRPSKLSKNKKKMMKV